jgi:ABC-2 type transport system ATP-binding protein
MSATDTDPVVVSQGIGKRYGERWVLRELGLQIHPGEIVGLLGPNGAGKTTAVRILTTLLTPDEGRASVAGFDVRSEPQRVREHIGLAGQSATVDELLTGRANLEMVGRLYHLPRPYVRARAAALLERLSLTDAADRQVRTYSGGMRRRLDLAASLLAQPPVCFLDEPTTGLDPHSRNELWRVLRELVAGGTAILLTTQYLEEADQLCDHIVVVDHGCAIAEGSPAQLKSQIGEERVVVSVAGTEQLEGAARALAPFAREYPEADAGLLQVSFSQQGSSSLLELVRALDAAGAAASDISRRLPTLDEVFLTLTGGQPSEGGHAEQREQAVELEEALR